MDNHTTPEKKISNVDKQDYKTSNNFISSNKDIPINNYNISCLNDANFTDNYQKISSSAIFSQVLKGFQDDLLKLFIASRNTSTPDSNPFDLSYLKDFKKVNLPQNINTNTSNIIKTPIVGLQAQANISIFNKSPNSNKVSPSISKSQPNIFLSTLNGKDKIITKSLKDYRDCFNNKNNNIISAKTNYTSTSNITNNTNTNNLNIVNNSNSSNNSINTSPTKNTNNNININTYINTNTNNTNINLAESIKFI